MSSNIEDIQQNSLLSFFTQTKETLEDAKKKSASESNSKTEYFQMSSDGTYSVRILPLAPVILSDGSIDSNSRKGYEYPLKDLGLKIEGLDKDKKPTTRTVFVPYIKLVYPQLKDDLIDLYVRIACEKYADDKKLCDKLTANSFQGGLKYNSKRCAYVLDTQERNKGMQILQLSYSQYRDLEDAKLRLWGKLAQKNPGTPCPISSPISAFPVEITRKTENRKVNYSLNIDTIGGTDELSQEELQTLLDAQRLPEVLYIYRRRHLEATIEFLKQTDSKLGINIMELPEIQDCIDQIKMCLPADDNSHFTFAVSDGAANSAKVTIEKLWEQYDEIEKAGLNDRSEEGQNFRTLLREFIEEHDLDIRVDRKKSNIDVLEEIDALIGHANEESDSSYEEPESDDDSTYSSEPEPDDEPEILDDSEDESPERNDDTNEPAARASHRITRLRSRC